MFKVAVIPAYNESASLKAVIDSIAKYFDRIVVVDDCSTDQTPLIASDNGCIVHSNSINLGYDKSILIGLGIAIKLDPSIIITLDADGQHPANTIPSIIDYIVSSNCDVLLCSRTSFPRFSEYISSYLSRILYSCPDLFTGMKCYCRRSLDFIPSLCSWDSVGTYYAFLALNRNLKVHSFPITCSSRVGISRFGSSIRSESKILTAFIYGIFRAV